MKYSILYYPDDITLLYSLYPILASGLARDFDFFVDPEKALRSRNRTIVLFRFYKRLGDVDPIEYLGRLRQSYDRIVYFDDMADPREVRAEFIDLVDLYYKKQLLADRSLYARETYGKRLFTQHYHDEYGEVDEAPAIAPPLGAGQIAKLRLSWNLGAGSYPKSRARRGIAYRLSGAGLYPFVKHAYAKPWKHRGAKKSLMKVSARFSLSFDRRTVARHRELFRDAALSRPDLFLYGRIPLAEYNEELRCCAATLSPFGWGEICFRDFEAIINDSLLLKPSMDHIETWPDVYRAGVTYVPLDWDAEDAVAAAEAALGEEAERLRIVANAREAYIGAFADIGERARGFLAEL
jgi:hypothetical protein